MKNIKIEIKWAIIFALMTLLWMVLERSVGLHDTHIDKHAVYTNFIAIPAISVYVFALLDKRKSFYHGKMTYLQGFICGLIITLFVTVLSPLTQYITSTIITPDYFENAIAYGVSIGKITPEAAEDYFNLENYIIQGLIGAPFMGLITTALVAIFTRKN
ncbi:DUF4199 domain-containing protein [Cognataquiflexum aquatile]|uniref:DUF4199 domain-containing protein n=1 Tax=Cognataquiflexum aquatile TaxID=2249427 RepID=UPI000DEB1C53|nr:DUF4199 domain-containing protein [Cognataquiflexum aquatile]